MENLGSVDRAGLLARLAGARASRFLLALSLACPAVLAGGVVGGVVGESRAYASPVSLKTVSFTFDDGPSSGYTAQVLDLLAQHGIRATFCLVGTEAQRFPALVSRIRTSGHALCNHSWQHADLATMTPAAIRTDLTAADSAIRAGAPGADVLYFRAPYGSWGQSMPVAASMSMSRLGWTVDPEDWSRPGADVIIQRVRSQLRPGGVVLMHDAGGDRSQTVQALQTLLPQLKQEGWTFVLPQLSRPHP